MTAADATERVCNRTGAALNGLREMGAAVTLIPTFDGSTGRTHGPYVSDRSLALLVGDGRSDPVPNLRRAGLVGAPATWGDTERGQQFEHPDGSVYTVKGSRRTHMVIECDCTRSTDEELHGRVFTDRAARTAPFNPNLRQVVA